MTMPLLHQWLKRPSAARDAGMRLICFPHAGAGASSFARWMVETPPALEIIAVQLPGREQSAELPAVDNLDDVVPVLADTIASLAVDGVPCALYGHSLGAALASRVASALADTTAARPLALLVSGRRAPHLPGRGPVLHRLSNDDLLAALATGGGAELLRRPLWQKRYLELVRNDLAALERLTPLAVGSLRLPIFAFHAVQDPWVSTAEIAAWQQTTLGPFALRRIGGGHFDHHRARKEIMAEALALGGLAQDDVA
jgi:surfactin synthase thioesterase subunit